MLLLLLQRWVFRCAKGLGIGNEMRCNLKQQQMKIFDRNPEPKVGKCGKRCWLGLDTFSGTVLTNGPMQSSEGTFTDVDGPWPAGRYLNPTQPVEWADFPNLLRQPPHTANHLCAKGANVWAKGKPVPGKYLPSVPRQTHINM